MVRVPPQNRRETDGRPPLAMLLFAGENSAEPPLRRGFSRAIEVASEALRRPLRTRFCVLRTAEEQHKGATQARSVAMTRWVDHPGGSGEPMGRCTRMSVDVVESARLMPCLI